MTELTVFQRLVSMSQNDTRLNLPAATVFEKLVDAFLSDGYSIIPSVGWWKQDDFATVISKRTSPKWDIDWKIVDDEASKTALFELEDAGYIIHVIYEVGGENVWFITLHGENYHEMKKEPSWESCNPTRRSNADKRNDIEKALRHPNGVVASNRAIARHVGVAEKTVAAVRRKLESVAHIPQTESRTETFPSGAVRDTQLGKSRPDLVSPLAMERLGQWLRLGAEKYGDRNWEKGISQTRCFASLYRHILKYQEGDTTEDHLAAIFCNAMFLIHNEEAVWRCLIPDTILDLPSYQPLHNDNGNRCCLSCRFLGIQDSYSPRFKCLCAEQTKYQPIIYGEPNSWDCCFHQPKDYHVCK